MANLVIDIGSLSVKAALAEGGQLGKIFRYQGYKVADFILRIVSGGNVETCVVSSSGPLDPNLIKVLKENCREVILPGDFAGLPVDFGEASASLPPDRKASIVAASFLFKGRDVMVFDLGSMISVDFVDGKGRYCGGAVSPGLRSRYKAVARYSSGLPALDTPDFFIEKGMNISECIHSGVNSGIIFEIEGYLQKYREYLCVFTGGDAFYFAGKMKRPIFAVCNLVLKGLALIACHFDFDETA